MIIFCLHRREILWNETVRRVLVVKNVHVIKLNGYSFSIVLLVSHNRIYSKVVIYKTALVLRESPTIRDHTIVNAISELSLLIVPLSPLKPTFSTLSTLTTTGRSFFLTTPLRHGPAQSCLVPNLLEYVCYSSFRRPNSGQPVSLSSAAVKTSITAHEHRLHWPSVVAQEWEGWYVVKVLLETYRSLLSRSTASAHVPSDVALH